MESNFLLRKKCIASCVVTSLSCGKILRFLITFLKYVSYTNADVEKYKTALLQFFGKQYVKRGWVMQIHYGDMKYSGIPTKSLHM